MTILQTTTTILICWIVFIIAWERISPYRKGLPFFREGFWVDLVWYTIIQSYVLKIVIFDYIIYPLQHHINWNGFQFFKDWTVTEQVLFFLVTHDLYIYLFHRLQHASKILWRTHEAHHSGKDVDFLAGSRSHAFEIIINQTIEFAPIIILGADPAVIPIKAMLDAMFGMFIHANVNVRLGKLKYIFNSPELHLWHHANYHEVFHANLSTKFALWDYLFGTVYDPAFKPGNQPENWGLYYDYPKDYFLQHAFSVKRFDEKGLLKYKWFRYYYEIRPNLILKIKKFLKLNKGATIVNMHQPELADTDAGENLMSYNK
ncbi:sterol desaturase family protein [Mucilaginibacter sp. OK098]|uniref:sterol desaturase family protein n=1 Tax=Mucilaginibacter sp. OK098 TaxID=1855297 RepID=UPI0009193657|nr:sterol desaturase family protein [Mucilaginibacter sp. OK098]SHM74330.1 Sterol desaturase/sphingolipid hydroxylase, fatty acid hydroxylase superfamily [Mucilaginibacter sp. OK098]